MERLMTRREAAEFLGFAPQTLARYAWLGKGPQVTKVGRLVRYTQASLEAWLASVSETNDKPAAAHAIAGKVVTLGPRVTIGGVAYYPESQVAKAMHRLGAVWISWEPAKDDAQPAA